tara:strand:+ start:707 stop:1006 length:300 start_codon:yes stop_codon:yes gene_type:complete
MSSLQPQKLSPLQIRAIGFLDNEGKLTNVPKKYKAFRKAILDETKRRLQVEIKDILKRHPSKKKRLNIKYRNLTPTSLHKRLQTMTLSELTKLNTTLHA